MGICHKICQYKLKSCVNAIILMQTNFGTMVMARGERNEWYIPENKYTVGNQSNSCEHQ